MGVTGQSATASVGDLSPADVMGVSGVSATVSLGDVAITTNPIIIPTSLSMTSAQEHYLLRM